MAQYSTQKVKVMNFMRAYGEISQRDGFNIGVYRLADVIFRMKKDGVMLHTDYRKVLNADGSTSRVAFYSLISDENQLTLPFEE